MDLFELAESVEDSPLIRRFAALSKRLNVVLPISFFERAHRAFYNSLVVLDAGRCLGLYRKSHIPDGPGYQEKYFFNPGDTGFRVWETQFGTIGVGICWDQWFPECARIMALQGAEILFYPTAIGTEPQDAGLDSSRHWRLVMQGHAGANLVPVVASNRIGKELTNTFYGTSFIADHLGEVVQSAADEREILLHTFDLGELKAIRASWGIFRDRRPDLYTPLLTLDGFTIHPGARAALGGAVLETSSSSSSSSVMLSGARGKTTIPAAVDDLNRRIAADLALSGQQQQQEAGGYHGGPAEPLSTPAADGFLMPAEWEAHESTWMCWPFRPDNWRENAIPAQSAWRHLISQIAKFEPVNLLTPAAEFEKVSEMFESLHGRVRVLEMAQNDAWIRDTGPIFVVRKISDPSRPEDNVRGVDFEFNAWGGVEDGCYPHWDQDQLIPKKVLAIENKRRYDCPLVLEGGSVLSDGQGTVIVTEECLLHPNRSLDGKPRSKAELEACLRDFLGAKKVIWLPFGTYGDVDTNGHVDNICSFIAPATVLLHWTEDEADPQYERSLAALKVLESSTDSCGRGFRVVKLPQPSRPLLRSQEEKEGLQDGDHSPRQEETRLPATYANLYIANGAVFVPTFQDPNDEVAISIIQEVVGKERKVIPIPGREILLGGGNIHCITQQQPRPRA